MARPDALFDIEPDMRDDLLGILTSPRHIRAEAIRKYYGKAGGQNVADLLIDLEVDEEARAETIDRLRNPRQQHPA